MRAIDAASRWPLVLDLTCTQALAWLATRRPGSELTPEVHLFFYDRYARLGAWHRQHGHLARARHLMAKAEAHWDEAGGDGPPYAVAKALPRPKPWVRTDAVSRKHLSGSDDAA